jgi:hypothetical protein
MTKRRKLSVGDWVEVRSKAEVLSTLDSKGQLDGMPFMPEMFEFCGEWLLVYKRAHKTCDPDYKSRRIENAVHLETRCDGREHGGCQARCLIFWKDAWLKPAGGRTSAQSGSNPAPHFGLIDIASVGKCTESRVWDRVQVRDADGDGLSYICQATQVQYEALLPWWDVRQYVEDYLSGNVSFWRLISGTVYSAYYNLSQSGFGLGSAMRWLYDKAGPLWHGSAWPRKKGLIPEGQPTPTAVIGLQTGELVRVKSHEEILATVNAGSRNRGLWWDAELVPYCGGTYRVLARVTNVIDERTGKMQVMKNPCIILDAVVCQARYSACRMFCPRSTYAYWREIWLERVESQVAGSVMTSTMSAAEAGTVSCE